MTAANMYDPVYVEDMRKDVASRTKAASLSKKKRPRFRVALVLGPNFPSEVADLYCAAAFKKNVIVEQIPCTDPRVKAIQGGAYEGGTLGTVEVGLELQPVFLLSSEHAQEFDAIEAVNFYDYQGGMVCAISCSPDEVEHVLKYGL